MTAEEFNALPLEARRFIEAQMKCASCGGKKDLDFHYKKYLQMKETSLYVLRNGAVRSIEKDSKVAKILYPISPNDSQEVKMDKLTLALKINEVKPDAFQVIDVEGIKDFLAPFLEDAEAERLEAERLEAEKLVEDDLIGPDPKPKKK